MPPAFRPPRMAYADCFAGFSGALLMGALIHAGLEEQTLRRELDKLDAGPFTLAVEKRSIHSIEAIAVAIEGPPQPELRQLSSLLSLLDSSELPSEIIGKAAAVCRALAAAEAKVRGIAPEHLHLKHPGTIITIVGSLIGLHHLGIERLTASPLPLGQVAGACPPLRPEPAVCELLRGIPVYGVSGRQEVSPAGAALLKVLTEGFGPMETMTISGTGYGAEACIRPDSRLFRLIIGEINTVNETQEVEIIETNIDDWSPEGFPHVCELLLAQGALDVSITPIQMKKGRPGFRLQVICKPAHGLPLKETILSETSAIGLRFRREQRYTLRRQEIEVTTRWGRIRAKKVWTPAGIVLYPEYEACRKVAAEQKVPLQQVYREVCSRGEGRE